MNSLRRWNIWSRKQTRTDLCSLLMSFFFLTVASLQVSVPETILYSASAYLEFLAKLLANAVYGILRGGVTGGRPFWFLRLYRKNLRMDLWIYFSKFHAETLPCIKQLTLWFNTTHCLIIPGLWDMFCCKESGLSRLRHSEMQPGILRPRKIHLKGPSIQREPRDDWTQLSSWKPTS